MSGARAKVEDVLQASGFLRAARGGDTLSLKTADRCDQRIACKASSIPTALELRVAELLPATHLLRNRQHTHQHRPIAAVAVAVAVSPSRLPPPFRPLSPIDTQDPTTSANNRARAVSRSPSKTFSGSQQWRDNTAHLDHRGGIESAAYE